MRSAGKILLIAFVLNFIWEISQAFLYAPHFVGVSGLIKVHIRASLGDVLLVCLILMVDVFVFNKFLAQEKMSGKRIALVVLFGFIIGVAVEKYALVVGRWSYNDLMPVIPFLKVGLTPVLQMTFIPAVAMLAVEKIKRRKI